MHLFKLTLGLAVVIMCGGSAAAEPITATYEITLTSRTALEVVGEEPTIVTEPFEQQFVVAMTFDPSRGIVGSGLYGPPEFSAIPLPVILEPAGLPLTQSGFTLHGPIGPLVLGAIAEQTVAGSNDDVVYSRSVRLERRVFSGPFTPEAFPIHLHSGTFSFVEALSVTAGPSSGEFRRITYEGTAALLDTSVVPEPSAVLLGGSGLALILAKIRRRRARAHPDATSGC